MKTAFLNLVKHTHGSEEQTVATIRANKNGTKAEVRFVGGMVSRFETVRKAWEWLAANSGDSTYFELTENYPSAWKKNFV